MAGEDDGAEKSHEPSQRKLDEARKKGEIPRTADLQTAMAYLGLLLCGTAVGGYCLQHFAEALLPMIEQPDRLERIVFNDGSTRFAGALLVAGLTPAVPILAVPGLFVLLTLLGTRGIVFNGAKLAPKISRINPIENAKNKFGRRGLFEFFKSFVKLTVYSILLALFLRGQLDLITGTVHGSPAQVVLTLISLVMRFLFIVVLIATVIGAIDAFWQRGEHHRKNRMSLKELRDEMKEAEGDPQLKAHRRMKAQELALNQMMKDVPGADVVIVNPTHYSVALTWDRMPGSAPVCVAKGTDMIAARIREVAQENDIPIHSDPPTARALFATTRIGEQIATEHYRPVAAAIRFAETMRRKAKQKGWR